MGRLQCNTSREKQEEALDDINKEKQNWTGIHSSKIYSFEKETGFEYRAEFKSRLHYLLDLRGLASDLSSESFFPPI